jgi:hypothetical protein
MSLRRIALSVLTNGSSEDRMTGTRGMLTTREKVIYQTTTGLQAISYMPQQNYAAAKVEHSEKVLSVSFVADN